MRTSKKRRPRAPEAAGGRRLDGGAGDVAHQLEGQALAEARRGEARLRSTGAGPFPGQATTGPTEDATDPGGDTTAPGGGATSTSRDATVPTGDARAPTWRAGAPVAAEPARPRITAPAFFNLRTTSASSVGIRSLNNSLAPVVRTPAVSILSLTATGMP